MPCITKLTREGRSVKEPSPLGLRLRRARERLGASRRAVSIAAEIPYTTLRNIENHPAPVKTNERYLKALADELSLPYEELRILAGYQVRMSDTLDEASGRLAEQLGAYPHLAKQIAKLLDRADQQEIDTAAEYLEFQRRRRDGR